uniref:hypothetical protein n=1 Tax=Limosilactobacillus fermentum TaxID=1613 RepID=UPI000B43B942|nr:hypothetical protein [Limosilactobacillus fermentum]
MMDQIERTRVLSNLVKINSVNGNELEVANYLRRLFEQHGLTADVQPFGEQRIDRYGEGLMKLCYIGVGLYVFYDSGLVTHLLKLI